MNYGKKPLVGNGQLLISIDHTQGKHVINILDNGPGLNASKMIPYTCTGKGLEIIDEIVRLYYDLKNIKIRYSLENVMEIDVCMGTKVLIEIPD